VEAFFQRSLQTALDFKAMVEEYWFKEKGDHHPFRRSDPPG
jgi:hypothetical protein